MPPFLSGVLYEGFHCSTACACVCVFVLKLSIHQIMEASGNHVKKINPHSGDGEGGKSGGKKDILGPICIVIINPRRACAARVTVVGSVCVCVCLLSHISPMERLFVLKTLSRTQRATKVKTFVGFSLKPLRCRLPPLCCRAYSRPFFLLKARMRILAPPSVFPAYNYISAATRLFAFATSCPAQRGKADVPVRFAC